MNTDLSVEAPQITRAGGIFASGLTTTITAAADAEIYYTIDGSFPTVNSVRYNGETLRFGGEGAKSYLLRAVATKTAYTAMSRKNSISLCPTALPHLK